MAEFFVRLFFLYWRQAHPVREYIFMAQHMSTNLCRDCQFPIRTYRFYLPWRTSEKNSLPNNYITCSNSLFANSTIRFRAKDVFTNSIIFATLNNTLQLWVFLAFRIVNFIQNSGRRIRVRSNSANNLFAHLS